MMLSYKDIENLSNKDFYELYNRLEEMKKNKDVIPLIDNLETVWERLQKKGCIISYNGEILNFNELDFNW